MYDVYVPSFPVTGVTALVGVGDGVLLDGDGAAMLVGVWSCITVLVDVGDGLLLDGSGVAVSSGVRPPVD